MTRSSGSQTDDLRDPDPKRRLRFGTDRRIKSSQEFSRTYRSGNVVADHMLVIHGEYQAGRQTRLGLSIPKKTGHAPRRNRWKRLIREAFRHQQYHLPTGWKLVIRPRKGAQPDYASIAKSLRHLTRRLQRKQNP